MHELHAAIMNLPSDTVSLSLTGYSMDEVTAYKLGFRDARHAAAELAIATPAAVVQAEPSAQDKLDAELWKELAEDYYAKVQYPDSPELARGALDALFAKKMRERAK